MKINVVLLVLAVLTASTQSLSPQEGSPELVEDGPLYNFKYCEILMAKMEPNRGIKAEVYNSMPCNQCPQEQWTALNFDAIAKEYGALKAVANGPRYWVLDNMTSKRNIETCTETFGEMEMSKVATVSVSPRRWARKSAYQTAEVDRNTIFLFKAGREVYVLESPEGECYIMQSYSQTIDESLQLADLKQLGERLDLPVGWSFKTLRMERDFELTCPNGKASVLQDDLKNTYQYIHEGCLN